MDQERLLVIFVQASSFIAAFAAIAAGILISSVIKKFGTGILASGFRTISFGVFFVAVAIILDTFNSYLQIQGGTISTVLLVAKEFLFVIGTFMIVIGSKNTADKLESLIK